MDLKIRKQLIKILEEAKEIQKLLKEASHLDDFKKLFIEILGFKKVSNDFVNVSENIKDLISDSKIIAEFSPIFVFYFKLNLDFDNNLISERNIRTKERTIIREIIKTYRRNHLFIFSDNKNIYWDFVYPFNYGNRLQLKRFNINPDNRNKLRTPSEQLSFLIINEDDKESIFEKLEKAFNTEAVSEKFYKDYISVFNKVKNALKKQFNNEEKIHWFTHQLLNRLMFLYFVQKRGVFGGNKNFLAYFWDTYRNFYDGKDEFYDKWLKVLFFEALNGEFTPKDYFKINEKIDLNSILLMAPYLNGGLFKENTDFDYIDVKVKDDLFEDIFDFLESYNFTVRESTPLDEDLDIDPEMLGNIYEYLVNVEEIEGKRGQEKAGIFYTPKLEIELMIKRSLVEFLYNKTKISKDKLYQFIFPEEFNEISNPFNREEAGAVLNNLEDILILDPACGSGHYLVVAVNILYELKEIFWKTLEIPYNSRYEEKKKIIERNIYGNDIKEWAVNIAKLRLWLNLFLDIPDDVLSQKDKPLLPNLKFKIRCGDSLVQRIGNELIHLRRFVILDSDERSLLKEIKENKVKVYKNEKDPAIVITREKDLLLRIITKQKIKLQQEIQKLDRELNHKQLSLDKDESYKLDVDQQKEISQKKEELKSLNEYEEYIRKKLNESKEIPMIWDLSFAEVFEIKGGFDIIIANPPYVRQEKIEDLTGFYSKSEYKARLIQQIKSDWSYDYEGKEKYRPNSRLHPIPQKFDNRSDLYVYFYLKGLKLLNPDGVLCYISSNSWLDVGFGRVLQEVLIKRCPIVGIYDNQVKRSFKHADVNTIIALIKAPKERDFDEEVKNNEVRFVMFKKPFEEVMYSEIFIDLEKDYDLKEFQEGKRRENEIYRLHIVNQKDLWEFGKDEKTGEYIGNKWGGKYLRAPEIYWKILEKGKGKLVRLGDIAEVRFGIKTGANEFFYVEDITDKIEDE